MLKYSKKTQEYLYELGMEKASQWLKLSNHEQKDKKIFDFTKIKISAWNLPPVKSEQ